MNKTGFLVADDSATVRRLIRQVIEHRLGAQSINEAHDGMEALEILKGGHISFIISDWEMPRFSGKDFLLEVRKNADWKKIPFLMVTAHSEQDFILEAIESGVSDYLVKPFTAHELEEKVRRIWTGASRRRAERYYNIPAHTVTIRSGGREYPARVLNISRLGVLLGVDYQPGLKICKIYEMDMDLTRKDNGEMIRVHGLTGYCTRLELEDSYSLSSQRLYMALYFGTGQMDPEAEAAMNKLIRYLSTLAPELIK